MVRDLVAGMFRRAEVSPVRRGRGCARRGALTALLGHGGVAGKTEEPASVARVAGDVVGDEYAPVSAGGSPKLTGDSLSMAGAR